MTNIDMAYAAGQSIKVPCPACEGKGEIMGRVQYRDGRGCRNEMCECPICDGRKQVTLDEAMQFNRKHQGRGI